MIAFNHRCDWKGATRNRISRFINSSLQNPLIAASCTKVIHRKALLGDGNAFSFEYKTRGQVY